jgi:hypothetical protein
VTTQIAIYFADFFARHTEHGAFCDWAGTDEERTASFYWKAANFLKDTDGRLSKCRTQQ